MKIPETFQLGPFKYRVFTNPSLTFNEALAGQHHNTSHRVELQSILPNSNIEENEVKATFFHELVHAILGRMKRDELNADEAFVDQFAEFLLQYELTKAGEVNIYA